MSKEMVIKYGQKVKLTVKRQAVNEDGTPKFKNGFPYLESEETIEGLVSGVFEEDWCSVYSGEKHFVIDLR